MAMTPEIAAQRVRSPMNVADTAALIDLLMSAASRSRPAQRC